MERLTPRQHEIVCRTCEDGLTYKEVAYELDISEITIKQHCHAMFIRMGISGKRGMKYVCFLHGQLNPVSAMRSDGV